MASSCATSPCRRSPSVCSPRTCRRRSCRGSGGTPRLFTSCYGPSTRPSTACATLCASTRKAWLQRLLYSPASKHAGARVKHRGLPRRRAEERLVKGEPAMPVGGADRAGVVAKPRGAVDRQLWVRVDERHVVQRDLGGCEVLPPADRYSIRGGVDARYVPRPGLAKFAEASPLT